LKVWLTLKSCFKKSLGSNFGNKKLLKVQTGLKEKVFKVWPHFKTTLLTVCQPLSNF